MSYLLHKHIHMFKQPTHTNNVSIYTYMYTYIYLYTHIHIICYPDIHFDWSFVQDFQYISSLVDEHRVSHALFVPSLLAETHSALLQLLK